MFLYILLSAKSKTAKQTVVTTKGDKQEEKTT
jgi:hypothetical protein